MQLPGDADPKISAVVAYWNSRRPHTGSLPGRQHIDPVDLSDLKQDLLRHVWLLDVERDPFRFRLRLAGSALKAAGGPGAPGGYLDEVDGTGQLSAKLVTMCSDHRPLYRRGPPILPHAPYAESLESVLLPLAGDGATVDMIMGCTVYHWLAKSAPEPLVLR